MSETVNQSTNQPVTPSVIVDQEVQLGDVVQMKKKHPCGSDQWTVIRTGADIKIRCSGCGRVVMLDRPVFLKRRKKLLQRVNDVPPVSGR